MGKLKVQRVFAAFVAILGVVLIVGLCQPAAGATGRPSDRFWKAIETAEGRVSASEVDRRTGVQMSGREAKSGAVGVARTAAGSVQVRALGLGVSATVARRDGVQVLSELTEDESFADFELTLPPGVEPVADGAGGFDLVAEVGSTSRLVVGRLEKPWAVDAEGRKLSTHYVLQEDRIRQHVDVGGAEFPVIADPRLTFGGGVYLNLTGIEVKAIAGIAYSSGAVASILACNFAKLPTVIGRVVRTLCAIFGGASILSLMKTLTKIARSRKFVNSSCYQMKVIPRGNELKKVKFKGNCVP